MPGSDGGGEKTEKASPKKREDERKKGNIFMSKDLNTLVHLIVAFFGLQLFIGSFITKAQHMYTLQLDRALHREVLDSGDIMEIFMEFCSLLATTLLPMMLLVAFASLIIANLQSRFLFSHEQIKFKLERISPLKGFKRLFSLRSLVELVKSLLKVILITWLLYGRVKAAIVYLPLMFQWEIYQAATFAGDSIMALVLTVAIAFGAVAGVDYLYQWWEYEKSIRMSKQEVKDEYKQMEGNPEVRSARRQKQREFATNRMMQQVKDADVIVRNPTHYAVALKYRLEVDPAPVVLAKGQDNIALKIIEEAEKYNITTVENKPLARGLYELSHIDETIPAEFYQPVAELLAWLYSTREEENGIL